MTEIPLVIQAPRIPRFVNVGEDPPYPKPGLGWIKRRQWKGCLEYGFLSAGQGQAYSRPFETLNKNDVIAAYIIGRGYVDIGRVLATSIPINKFLYNDKTLVGLNYLQNSLFNNSNQGNIKSEYAVKIHWTVPKEKSDAQWEKNAGLFASRLTQCSLENQPKTIEFIEKTFKVKFHISQHF